jgi:hypothetical protein
MLVLSIELSPLQPRREVFSKIIQIVSLFLYSNKMCKLQGVQHYVIKFVSDLRQVGVFLGVLRFSPPIKLTATI